ncbi:hypothetical protein [Streptomyces sp. TP-A0874]|nr:hypothetical protein [Streptomyces sp. TP-A0874]
MRGSTGPPADPRTVAIRAVRHTWSVIAEVRSTSPLATVFDPTRSGPSRI